MAKESIKRPESEATTFCGMEAKKVVRSDGTITFAVNNQPFFDTLGIEKAVRDEVTTKVEALAAEVAKEMSNVSLKNKLAPVEVRLGQGSFSQEYKFQSKYQRGGVNPSTKEPYAPKYGRVEFRLNFPWGKSFKAEGGLIAEIEKAHEAANKKAAK